MTDAAIFLCSRTANMALPWAAAGVECWCVDVQHSIRREHVEGKIHFVWGDVRSWRPPEGLKILFVAAFPPCTQDAVSGARDFETKGGHMLRDSLETFEAARMACAWSGAPYMVEHPVTCLVSIPHIGPPSHKFNPNDYGDPYTKETWLWTGNGFRMPAVVKPGDMFDEPTWIEPTEGSKMHLLPPSADRQDIRAATPMGFSTAVFWANAPRWRKLCHPDHPCQVRPLEYQPGQKCDVCTGFWQEGESVICGRGRHGTPRTQSARRSSSQKTTAPNIAPARGLPRGCSAGIRPSS